MFAAIVLVFSACSDPKLQSDSAADKNADPPFSFEEKKSATEVEPEPAKKETAPIQLPLQRTIVDSSGRKLEANVLAKRDGFLAVERILDEKQFSLNLADLSESDQAFFANVQDSSIEEVKEYATRKSTSPTEELIGAMTSIKPDPTHKNLVFLSTFCLRDPTGVPPARHWRKLC